MRINQFSICLLLLGALLNLATAEEQASLLKNEFEKRFSMNYLDLIEPQNPRSWRNTITGPNSKSQEKRFSMNYFDLVDPKDPVSWRNRLLNSEKKPEKRFSMNFLDTLGAGDPLSWENTMRNKGGAGGPTAERAARLRRERSLTKLEEGRQQNDLQAKRSTAQTRSVAMSNKAQAMVENIDSLLHYAMDTYGPAACRQPILNGLLKMRASLEPLLPRDHQNNLPEEILLC